MNRNAEGQAEATREIRGTPGRARKTHLVKQVGEHPVSAEIGRLDLLAPPFSGNVPGCGIVAVDEFLNTIVIQVKTAQSAAEGSFAWQGAAAAGSLA